METEAAVRSYTRRRVPEAYWKYVEEKRRSDNEGIRLKTNRYYFPESLDIPGINAQTRTAPLIQRIRTGRPITT